MPRLATDPRAIDPEEWRSKYTLIDHRPRQHDMMLLMHGPFWTCKKCHILARKTECGDWEIHWQCRTSVVKDLGLCWGRPRGQ